MTYPVAQFVFMDRQHRFGEIGEWIDHPWKNRTIQGIDRTTRTQEHKTIALSSAPQFSAIMSSSAVGTW